MNSKYNILKKIPIHIIIKWLNDEERIMKAANEKRFIIYKEFSKRLTANFSPETTEVRRQRNDIFKVFQDKNCQPRILY